MLGFSRLPETSLDRMEQAAVICHGTGLPHLEKLFRQLRQEAELYFKKNAGFDRDTMRNTVAKLYTVILALQAKNGQIEARHLAGEHKSSYFDIPPLELAGMGAGAWSSKAGYEGITYYFFNEKLRKWFTYTETRPTYYEGTGPNIKRMHKAAAPWGIPAAGAEFSKSTIKLTNGKLSPGGRLSASEQSQGVNPAADSSPGG